MECGRQPRLFCRGEMPLVFFVPPCAEADRLRLLITSGGGAVVARPGGVGVIHLVTGSSASGTCDPVGGQRVHARFVEECFSKQRLLPLRDFLPRKELVNSPAKSDFELRPARTHSSPPRSNGLLASATKQSSPARAKRSQELIPAKAGVGGRCEKCFTESEPVEHTAGQLVKLAGVAQVRSESSHEIVFSDQLSDELVGVAQVRSAPAGAVHAEAPSVAELSFGPGHRRVNFNDADDQAMIRWASCHPQLRDQGRRLWEMAERARVTCHGWASMQTRWRRHLKKRPRNSEAVSSHMPKQEKIARVVRQPAATASRLERHFVEQPTVQALAGSLRSRNSEAVSSRVPKQEKISRVVRQPAVTASRLERQFVEQPMVQALAGSLNLPQCILPVGQQAVVQGCDDAMVGSGAGVAMEGRHEKREFAVAEWTSRTASDNSAIKGANRCTSPPRLTSPPPIRALMQHAPLWLQATQRLEVHIDDHDI